MLNNIFCDWGCSSIGTVLAQHSYIEILKLKIYFRERIHWRINISFGTQKVKTYL